MRIIRTFSKVPIMCTLEIKIKLIFLTTFTLFKELRESNQEHCLCLSDKILNSKTSQKSYSK